jgi:hypothetical protein
MIKRLSSRITFFYKYVLPLFNLFIIIVCGIGVLKNLDEIELLMPFFLGLSFFFFLQILYIPLFKLKDIYYNEDVTLIINKGKIDRYYHSDIKRIKRYCFYFFRVEFNDTTKEKILFLPRLSEVFFGFNFIPKSIKSYRTLLEHSH